ncbi:MAG: NAD(P)H-dependent oxidoreductase subunit E [Planctomycetota bacterium]
MGNGVSVLEVQPTDLDLDGVAQRMQSHAERVAELIRRYPVPRAALLQVLWLVQEEFGWVPRVAIKWAAQQCQVAPVQAFAVVEFYTMYQQIPPARWHIRVCHNVSCHIQGSEELIAHLEQKLGIQAGEHTADGLFALERVECLAACGNGPAVQVNDEFLFGPGEELNRHQEGWRPTPEVLDQWIERLRARAEADPQAHRVDELGGILLGSGGHPGAMGATAQDNATDYAPPPPALQVAGVSVGEAVTVSALCAPEVTQVELQRQDGEQPWRTVTTCDPRQIPGPPGPKQVRLEDRLEIGVTARYRLIATSGERAARPSRVVEVTATEAPAEEGEAR